MVVVSLVCLGIIVAYLAYRQGQKSQAEARSESRKPSGTAEVQAVKGFENEILPLNETVAIHYRDSSGVESTRKITVKSASKAPDGGLYLNAFCHDRQGNRTFLTSRIALLADADTGESHGNPLEYFLEKLKNTDHATLWRWFKAMKSEIAVLIYVARIDGRFTEKERRVIAEFISQKTGGEVPSDKLEGDLRRTYCDEEEFQNHLDRLEVLPEKEKVALVEAAHRVAEATKDIDQDERKAVQAIVNRLAPTYAKAVA